MKKKLSK